jgi:methyltransferase-like protein 22
VGITSITASMYAKKVICTDINLDGILDLIRRNVKLNSHYQKSDKNIEVHELDFFDNQWRIELQNAITNVDICLAADGMY